MYTISTSLNNFLKNESFQIHLVSFLKIITDQCGKGSSVNKNTWISPRQ